MKSNPLNRWSSVRNSFEMMLLLTIILQLVDTWVTIRPIDTQDIEAVNKINTNKNLNSKIKWRLPTLWQILKTQIVKSLSFSPQPNKYSMKVREYCQSGVSKIKIQFYGAIKNFWLGRYQTICYLQQQESHKVGSGESRRNLDMYALMWIIHTFSNMISSHKESKSRKSHLLESWCTLSNL